MSTAPFGVDDSGGILVCLIQDITVDTLYAGMQAAIISVDNERIQ